MLPIMMMMPCVPMVLVPLLTVEVTVEAALALDAPPVILGDSASMRVNLPSATAPLLLVLLSLHVAEEGSLPRRFVEGGSACFGVAGLLGRHGQVLRAHLLVSTRGHLLFGVQDHCTANPHQVAR